MKFWAKVRFRSEKNAEYLIRAFFKEFNPESSIVIRGEEAKVEIIFNKIPPTEIVEAISHCEMIEFNFGKELGEYKEDKNEQVTLSDESSQKTEPVVKKEETFEQTEQVVEKKETFEQAEQVVAKEENSEQTKQSKKKNDIPVAEKVENTKVADVEIVIIPQLEEIAKKAKSYEHFTKLVAEWLEMDKRQELFENLLIVATEVEKICWKDLENALKRKGISYSTWDKTKASLQVSEKLKDYSVTMLPLLNSIVQYKDYCFEDGQLEKNSTEQFYKETVSDVEEVSYKVEETITKNRVRMECMPEIPHFEEILGSVDKTQPIEERVIYVLNAMGWKKKNAQEQKEIFEIANTAVRVGRMAFDIIFLKAKIPMESWVKARMTFSKFINDFVKEYDSEKKVKLLDFLKQLQEIVMYESEIDNFTDFTD